MSGKINESIVTDEIREHLKENRIDHMTYLPGMEIIESDIEKKVVDAMNAYDYDSYTAVDVRRALSHDHITLEDFAALLSPAALPFLEEMAQRAQKETRRYFGNSVYMMTPLYISNYCENYCIYCSVLLNQSVTFLPSGANTCTQSPTINTKARTNAIAVNAHFSLSLFLCLLSS